MKNLLLFLIALLYLLQASCGYISKPDSKAKTAVVKQNIEAKKTEWKVEEYKNAPIENIKKFIIVSKDEIYARNDKEIACLYNNIWKKLATTDFSISSFGCDGTNLIYSSDWTKTNLYFLPIVYGANIIKTNNEITLSPFVQTKIPFSNSVDQIEFLSRNKAVFFAIMEYGILNIDKIVNKNFFFSFVHKPMFMPSIDIGNIFDIIDSNLVLASTSSSICYIDKKDSSYGLHTLFELHFKNNKDTTQLNYTVHIGAFSTLKSGYFIYRNKFVTVKWNNILKKYDFMILRKVKTVNGRQVEPRSITWMTVTGDTTFWAVTANGLILKTPDLSDKIKTLQWEIVKEIPNESFNTISIIDSENLIAAGNRAWKIFKKDSNQINPNPDILKNPTYFSIIRMKDAGNTYGCGIADFDNNGINDVLYSDIGGPNKLFLNSDFANNRAAERGIEGKVGQENISDSYDRHLGIATADIDESGSSDCIITNLIGENSLFLNNGSGYFRDVTSEYNFNFQMFRSACAITGDVNNDGYLDIFSVSMLGSNRLFLNHYGSSFEESTLKSDLKSDGASTCAAFGDVNRDGWLDLYIGKCVKENRLYLNNGDGSFRDFTKESGTSCGILKKTNSVFFADIDNDCDLDLFVGNRGSGNKLFLNNGYGIFKDVTQESGLNIKTFTYASVYADFDNDGWLDISTNNLGSLSIYKNLGLDSNGVVCFEDVTERYIPLSTLMREYLNGYNTGAAVADLGSDGDIDVISAQFSGSSFILNNNTNISKSNKNFIKIKIEGSESNRDGIGIKIKLFKDGKIIGYREVNSGFGYASSSSKIQHFGISDTSGNYDLEIRFPFTKIVKHIKVKPGSFNIIKEHEEISEQYFLLRKAGLRYLFSKDFILTAIKIICIIVLIFLIFMIKPLRNKILKFSRFSGSSTIESRILYKCLIFSLFIYFLITIIINLSQNYFGGFVVWINPIHNIFLEDIFPITISFAAGIYYVSNKIKNEIREKQAPHLFDELYITLRKFNHGEGLLMNLNRLSLLIQNYEINIVDNDLRERINIAVNEYDNNCQPELGKLNFILHDISSFKKEYFKPRQAILALSENLKVQIHKTIGIINTYSDQARNMHEYKKTRNELLANIKRIKDELYILWELTKSEITGDINEAFLIVSQKFAFDKNKKLSVHINFLHNNNKPIIKLSELVNIFSIIFQNAMDAFGENPADKENIIMISSINKNDKLLVKIEDNGNGIKPELRDSIFLDNFSSKLPGHGFGLSYVRKTMEKYGGKIFSDKSSMGGAAFLLEFTTTNDSEII